LSEVQSTSIRGQTDVTETSVAALTVSLAALLFIPSAVRFALDTSSLAAGLLGACGLVIAIGVAGLYKFKAGRPWTATLITILAVTMGIIAHSAVASLWFPVDVERNFGSLAILLIVIVTSFLMYCIVNQLSENGTVVSINIIATIFVVIAVLSYAQIQPVQSEFSKPIFPFSEPSHYALSFAPFLIFICVRSGIRVRIALLLLFFIIAYLLESLSLVVAVGLAAVCSLSGSLLVIGLSTVILVLSQLDVSYFTDRLDFSEHSGNLSTLVYLQGVELINAGLTASSGWGIGFQQLGVTPLNVPTTELIYRILRDEANLRDGGFLAAKLIAEMGLIGAILAGTFATLAIRAGLQLRWISKDPKQTNPKQTLALSIVLAFAIDMFVRGVGYFSGTTVLVLAALLLCAENGYFKRNSRISA